MTWLNRIATLFAVAACGFLFLGAAAVESRAAEDARPNIIIMMADDMGISDIGCYGGEIKTPHIDGLAAKGLRFTQFYNTARCCPTRASLLTGLYPHQAGVGHMMSDRGLPGYRGNLNKNCRTIAEVLKPAGYATYMSGKWHLGVDDPTRYGFEQFYGTLVGAKTFWDADHFVRLPKGAAKRRYAAGKFYGTDALADHALDFLASARQTPERPWFLYLAFNAPHFPLHAPKKTIAKYADRYHAGWDRVRRERLGRMKQLKIVPRGTELTPRSPYFDWGAASGRPNPAWETLPKDRRADLARRMAIYAAMVDRMDHNIGRLLADLNRHGELANTLIIFTSDNGGCAEWDPHGFDIRSGPQYILHRGKDLERMGSPGTYHSVGSGWA